MIITLLWALVALLRASVVLAQATETFTASTTSTSATPSCTASQIASLCSYKEPGPEFAVASSGTASCWDYCNAHSPCSFVIFAAGNPYTGTGTCWLYPGETYDANAGSSDCDSPWLTVYSQPECAGESSTATSSDACTATATPSAVASACGYPEPVDCFYTCTASEDASSCLSQCAEAESCSYVVFNPHNPSNSPYSSGTCWRYTNGTYDAGAATTCDGDPEQFVYENLCPKPSSSSSSSSSSLSPSDGAAMSENGTADATTDSTPSHENLAPTNFLLPNTLVMGMTVLTLLGL